MQKLYLCLRSFFEGVGGYHPPLPPLGLKYSPPYSPPIGGGVPKNLSLENQLPGLPPLLPPYRGGSPQILQIW